MALSTQAYLTYPTIGPQPPWPDLPTPLCSLAINPAAFALAEAKGGKGRGRRLLVVQQREHGLASAQWGITAR